MDAEPRVIKVCLRVAIFERYESSHFVFIAPMGILRKQQRDGLFFVQDARKSQFLDLRCKALSRVRNATNCIIGDIETETDTAMLIRVVTPLDGIVPVTTEAKQPSGLREFVLHHAKCVADCRVAK